MLMDISGRLMHVDRLNIASPEDFDMRISCKAFAEGSGATGALKGSPVNFVKPGS